MEQEEAGEGAGGDGQRVDGGHHQHSASTFFYFIVLSSTEILRRSCINSSIGQGNLFKYFKNLSGG